MSDWFGRVIMALMVPILGFGGYALDRTGWRPAFKWEEEQRSFFEERERMIDRIKDGKITDYERGILHGLCRALDIRPSNCEKENGEDG